MFPRKFSLFFIVNKKQTISPAYCPTDSAIHPGFISWSYGNCFMQNKFFNNSMKLSDPGILNIIDIELTIE